MPPIWGAFLCKKVDLIVLNFLKQKFMDVPVIKINKGEPTS